MLTFSIFFLIIILLFLNLLILLSGRLWIRIGMNKTTRFEINKKENFFIDLIGIKMRKESVDTDMIFLFWFE